jgi:hypothetical protein
VVKAGKNACRGAEMKLRRLFYKVKLKLKSTKKNTKNVNKQKEEEEEERPTNAFPHTLIEREVKFVAVKCKCDK